MQIHPPHHLAGASLPLDVGYLLIVTPVLHWKAIEWERIEILRLEIRDTKGIFHAEMSTIKDRNGMDLKELEDIKKRWQQYTEELYEKDLHDPDNHDGMITHLEPDVLEHKVSGKHQVGCLGSITVNKASGGDGIPAQLFQILKDDAVKVLYSIH